jgi:hypothetical protein
VEGENPILSHTGQQYHVDQSDIAQTLLKCDMGDIYQLLLSYCYLSGHSYAQRSLTAVASSASSHLRCSEAGLRQCADCARDRPWLFILQQTFRCSAAGLRQCADCARDRPWLVILQQTFRCSTAGLRWCADCARDRPWLLTEYFSTCQKRENSKIGQDSQCGLRGAAVSPQSDRTVSCCSEVFTLQRSKHNISTGSEGHVSRERALRAEVPL